MTEHQQFRILVATDGSSNASIAVAAAVAFPWPVRSRVRAIVARGVGMPIGRSALVRDALDDSFTRVAASAQRALAQRWRSAEVVVADQTAVRGILAEARRFKARVIVLGGRGHGAVRRLLVGSVSRGVARGASCPVLIVQRAVRRCRTFLVAFDGSSNARRAATFVGRLDLPRHGRITLVQVVEPMALPSGAVLPTGVRATLRREVAASNVTRVADARRTVETVAATLRRRGRTVRTMVSVGSPLRELLAAVSATNADVLVVGARGVGGLRRLLLGSVAEGALNHCPVPVLMVR